jgi:hypothetical protein
MALDAIAAAITGCDYRRSADRDNRSTLGRPFRVLVSPVVFPRIPELPSFEKCARR